MAPSATSPSPPSRSSPAAPAPSTFRFAGGSVTGLVSGGGGTANALDYSGNGGVAATVNMQSLSATSTGGFASIQKVVGSSASDTLIGANADNAWKVTGVKAGSLNTTFTFSALENLVGGTGADTFAYTVSTGSVGSINGGGTPAGKGDWLDDSAFRDRRGHGQPDGPVGVRRDRGGQQRPHRRGGGGADNLTGGTTGGILLGGGGNDTLAGGTGRTAAACRRREWCADTITGGSDQDVVIGGTTLGRLHDRQQRGAVTSILAEWNRRRTPTPTGSRTCATARASTAPTS